jgi:hypothetical protein
MRIVQALLPAASVLVCIVLTLFTSDASRWQQCIHSIHKDAFTIGLSFHGLWLARVVVPLVLLISLPTYLFLQRRWAGYRWRIWHSNYCLLTILVTITLVLRFWQCPLAMDDSYLDYRYVQHWLSGQFDYNPGEHIMGFTSHLHVVALWLICSIFHTKSVDTVSYLFNCTLDAINNILLYFLIIRVYGRKLPAFVASLWFAVSMYNCAEVAVGKETGLVNLALLLCLWGVKTNCLAALPWIANALFLLRPEGLLAGSIILITALKTRGIFALKAFVLPCLITVAWYVFLYCYFGSIMPHGMIAKHKVFPPAPFWEIDPGAEFVALIGSQMTNSSLGFVLKEMGWWPFVAVVALAFVYAFRCFKEPCWVLYRNIALVQMIFLIITRPLVFGWYLCWFALFGPIIMACFTALAWPASKGGWILPLIIMRAAICFLAVLYLYTGIEYIPFNWVPYLERGVLYREAALFLQERTKGLDVVAASDVGFLGYYYKGPIIDVMGLITDKALTFYPDNLMPGQNYLLPPPAISAYKPKYLMAPFNHTKGVLERDPDFLSHYTVLKRFESPVIEDRYVYIWQRKEERETCKQK